ncbi:hypothetical protein [Vallitalea sp.]|jgi:hypothetical protein|uniref:hypothetical protein n=1 Tax=Vallitalea sp. TaxID=1882829 RepID=UPI0025DF66F9|nr:hypothetical protein [Vallitalea sp.]MCT4688015.1 hypothetical protein [Vallitalea sp.]
MKKNILKTVILIALIVFSLYQTTRLWFDDLSDHNLFYDIINYNTPTEESKKDDGYYFIKPDTMALYSPEEEYSLIKKTNKKFQELFINSINFLKVIVAYGEIVEKEIPTDVLWNKSNLLLKYPFLIESNLLAKDLNIKNLDFESNIDQFNEIIIVPTDGLNEYVFVYFINDKYYNDIQALRIKRKDIEVSNNSLSQSMKDIEKKQVLPSFMSTRNMGLDLFTNNVLLPEKGSLYTDVVYFKKPFYSEEELDSNLLEDYVNGFFKNNIKWKLANDEDPDKFTYTDESVFVYYDTKGVVEYINNDFQNRKDLSIIDSYYITEKFINKKDKIINKQEYSLTNYVVSGNETKFYFSYKYNDINVNVPKDYLETLDMRYPMEITVLDGQVINYKRIILDLELDDFIKPPEKFSVDYISVINGMLEKYPQEQGTKINNMFLGYKINYLEENMKLNWTVVTDNIIFNNSARTVDQE